MRKAVLLYNPLSGNRLARRRRDIDSVVSVLRDSGVEASCSPTNSAADTTEQTRRAVADGCDTVFACGGDGTIHDVLQGLVGTEIALGVIPMGTGNALAHDLGIPLSPLDAVHTALDAEPRRISAGLVECKGFEGNSVARYFTVAAGVGMDAYLFHQLDPRVKRRWGIASYYARATYLWLTHRMQAFSVELAGLGRYDDVTQLLAVRIRNFGSIIQELAPGASLGRDDLRLVIFRTRSRWAYLRFIARCFLRMKWTVKGIESAESGEVVCRSLSNAKIFVEADGEVLGTLPAKISIVPDAFTLLVPKSRRSSGS